MKVRTDNREDYLINILRLYDGENPVKTNDIAKLMSVAPASVTEMLNVLQKEDLVVYEKYRGVTLTDLGLRTAKDLRRKHRIFEKFLMDILDIEPDMAHDEACAFEHSISNDAADKLCRILGYGEEDNCDYCSEPCSRYGKSSVVSCRLTDIGPGDYVISYISSDDNSVIKELIHIGLVPGKTISVSETDGKKTIKAEGAVRVLSDGLASAVFVNQR